MDKVSDTVERIVKNDSKLKQLVRALEFSDTLTNRLNLADEYLRLAEPEKAITHLEICLKGAHSQDFAILYKLLQAYYESEQYQKVIEIETVLKQDVNFSKSMERIGYAFALYYTGSVQAAQTEFEAMDVQYSNYEQRLSYAQFLKETGQRDSAKAKLEELIKEFGNMQKTEKRFKADVIRKIEKTYKSY